MTKEQYLAGLEPFEDWKRGHDKYIEETLQDMEKWFEVKRFVYDYKDRASEDILKSLLAIAHLDYNCDLGELEDYLAKILVVPYKDIVEYRTKEFWDEIKDE